jgi:ApbE superfamily uncharacterized protein (UPF0280 family)
MTAHRAPLADGRWHFQHGPIDLVIGADGAPHAVAAAHEAAWTRFGPLLGELVAELPSLRRAVAGGCTLRGVVARRMWTACVPHAARFITPMAAVAGAVADELIDCYRRPGIRRAWVNNGGDIALHLAPGADVRVGLFADLARCENPRFSGLGLDGRFTIAHHDPVRGIATSGWRGRSFSLGIADSVTVLAGTAAAADAAATMIANAVDVDDARIVRRPASAIKDASDLGDRLVTVDVPTLDTDTVHRALRAGLKQAEALRAAGTIAACALVCQGMMLRTEPPRTALLEAA